MKYSVVITTGRQADVTAKAYSMDAAEIFIFAADLQEAAGLIPQGEKLALEACQNWKPEEQPPVKEKPQKKHYMVSKRSVEDMEADAAAYEASPAGQRFTKSIDAAIDFYNKHSNGGLLVSQISYLANKHKNNFLNGSTELAALYYRLGYRSGKAAGKK